MFSSDSEIDYMYSLVRKSIIYFRLVQRSILCFVGFGARFFVSFGSGIGYMLSLVRKSEIDDMFSLNRKSITYFRWFGNRLHVFYDSEIDFIFEIAFMACRIWKSIFFSDGFKKFVFPCFTPIAAHKVERIRWKLLCVILWRTLHHANLISRYRDMFWFSVPRMPDHTSSTPLWFLSSSYISAT